jgi:hypothetical protein
MENARLSNLKHQLYLSGLLRQRQPVSLDWFNYTVPLYDEFAFRRAFRVTKLQFKYLEQTLFQNEAPQPGRPKLEPRKELAILLWRLSGQESLPRIAMRFGVSPSTVCKTNTLLAQKIAKLAARFIR